VLTRLILLSLCRGASSLLSFADDRTVGDCDTVLLVHIVKVKTHQSIALSSFEKQSSLVL